MTAALPPAEVAARVPQLVKVCAEKYVLELGRRAYPGLPVHHTPAPPPGPPPPPPGGDGVAGPGKAQLVQPEQRQICGSPNRDAAQFRPRQARG